MAGIIDPLRAEAKGAVDDRARRRHRRPDDHRRPRRHRPGHRAASGWARVRSAAPSCGSSPTTSSRERLPELHVFGRVTPEDKLRLARTMQEQGLIVAMTGDAVNDAAALKQADIGVAMGSGSEVTKQAARMILTDDNFGTLVHAVEIGRRVYDKIVSYVRYQMTQLLALVFLFLAATVFNINEGVALTPPMVLYLLFFATAVGVAIIAVDPGRPRRHAPAAARPEGAHHQPGRGDHLDRLRRRAVPRRAAAAGRRTRRAEHRPRQRLADHDVRGDGPRHRVQRDRQPPRPGQRSRRRRSCKALVIALIPVMMLFLATQLPTLQQALLTTTLSPQQWLVCCCSPRPCRSWSRSAKRSASSVGLRPVGVDRRPGRRAASSRSREKGRRTTTEGTTAARLGWTSHDAEDRGARTR